MSKTKREERTDEILKAALKLFHSKGFNYVVMNDIAKECGMARTTLYDYFPSKYDILVRLIGDVVRMARQAVPQGETTYEKLVFLTAESLRRVQENRLIYTIFIKEQSNFSKETLGQFAELSVLWTHQMSSLFHEAIESGEMDAAHDVKDALFAYQALVNQKTSLFLIQNETIRPEEEAEKLMNIFWYGLYKKGAGQ